MNNSKAMRMKLNLCGLISSPKDLHNHCAPHAICYTPAKHYWLDSSLDFHFGNSVSQPFRQSPVESPFKAVCLLIEPFMHITSVVKYKLL